MNYHKNFGQYPYDVFCNSRGDGGMEYPMSTLITGARRNLQSLFRLIHEFMHDWYHIVLGNNEALTPWMDEVLHLHPQELARILTGKRSWF